ncbi:MAG: hypothetical protein IT368_05185, partial [Candidatus Hydrogenedentes bacterium]|nr:hypothetical protein [Candidatus Hydrogenedentota bacterium]
GPLKGGTPEGATVEIAAEVQDLRLQYYDGQQWYEAWEQSRNPEAIRVSVTLGDPRDSRTQISRSMLLPVPVE